MRNSIKKLIVAILSLITVFFAAASVAAQSNGLGVTPRQSFTMKAGEQASNTLFVNNLNKTQPLTIRISVVDFTALDDSGTAKLLQGNDQPQTPWSLKPYISLPDTVTIAAGQSKQIPFTIKLPVNVGAGTYYSAVVYNSANNNTPQNVSLAASTATLLFINVPGQASELLTLDSFGMASANTPNAKFKSVFSKKPEFFAYKLKNSGNVAENPAGSIVVKNMFGHAVAHIDNANPKAQLALIGQSRKFTGCNPKDQSPEKVPLDSNCTPLNITPGFYTATLAIYYGQNGQQTRQITATTHFWYLPAESIAFLIILLAIIVYVIYRLYHAAHRRRRRR